MTSGISSGRPSFAKIPSSPRTQPAGPSVVHATEDGYPYGWSKALMDRMFVESSDRAGVEAGTTIPTPLVLRANVGDCIVVTVENDLLTPTLKVKRRAVQQRYGALLDALYADA